MPPRLRFREYLIPPLVSFYLPNHWRRIRKSLLDGHFELFPFIRPIWSKETIQLASQRDWEALLKGCYLISVTSILIHITAVRLYQWISVHVYLSYAFILISLLDTCDNDIELMQSETMTHLNYNVISVKHFIFHNFNLTTMSKTVFEQHLGVIQTFLETDININLTFSRFISV